MIRSAGIRSDLMVMRGFTHVTEHPEYYEFRTPDEPDYWYGNCIVEKMPPIDPASVLARFDRHFPTSKHAVMCWDIPDFQMAEGTADWFRERDFSVERDVFLSGGRDINRFDLPAGITARPIGDDDWGQLIDAQQAIGVELGFADATHRSYLESRNARRRDQIARGEGQWFGAFDGDLLVADMGIFHDQDVARYQAVATHVDYRGRGICAALLGIAHEWAIARAPDATVLIATDATGSARRVYERVGFKPFEVITSVMKRAY